MSDFLQNPKSFSEFSSLVSVQLSSTADSAELGQFDHIRSVIIARVEAVVSNVKQAKQTFACGEHDLAWVILTDAAMEARAIDDALQAAWIAPRTMAAQRGRRATTRAFEERRATAAAQFLGSPASFSTQRDAIVLLETLMEKQSLAVGPNARTKLYAAHPGVKEKIASLPRAPKLKS
ncbi:hypothetical protein [Xanthomonas bromi]|uniref:hypothetical protein n=1 Tax=Xanthomonas bromi TaxID=56449 RepID=UPI0011118E6F|nr:hypothetical protein [Xanthomonas bromi]